MKTISPHEAEEMMKKMNLKPAAPSDLTDMDDIDWNDEPEDDETNAFYKAEETFYKLLNPETKVSLDETVEKLRELILRQPLPIEQDELDDECGMRGKAWKLFLNVTLTVSAEEYAELVSKGPSPVASKIKKDVDRTFKNDVKFHGKVSANELTRVLNAFAWKTDGINYNGLVFSYVQGMNVLAGIFLYVMPELDAFSSFCQFILHNCPSYVQPTIVGVHNSCKLFDECFRHLDPSLHEYLTKTSPPNSPISEIIALAPILSFSACTPTLDQAVLLWDFLLAFGAELNVLMTLAQVTLLRRKLLKSERPMNMLRTLPELNAKQIIIETVRHLKGIDNEMYGRLHDSLFLIEPLSSPIQFLNELKK